MLTWELFPSLVGLCGALTGLYYCYTNIRNLIAWKSISTPKPAPIPTDLFFSILVPARNESKNIINCIEAILAQDFPKEQFEVIFINDHSTDDTLELVNEKFVKSIRIIDLEDYKVFGKKAALKEGLKKAKGNWIITTDADCMVGKHWLIQFSNSIVTDDPIFCCGPVSFSIHNTNIEHFQQLDLIGMMGVTAGGIFRKSSYLANGANLAYKKSVFNEVNGFDGIDKKASGDDMLLLQKVVKKYPDQITFIKSTESIVQTSPEKNLQTFFNQRLRWASKGNSFPSFSTWLQMVLVFLFSFTLLFSFLLIVIQPWTFSKIFIGLYWIKFISDYFYLKHLSKFFKKEDLSKHIWWATIAHAFYIVVIGLSAQVYKTYDWKGRTTK